MCNSFPAFHTEGSGSCNTDNIIYGLYEKVERLIQDGLINGEIQISWRNGEGIHAEVATITIKDGKIQQELLRKDIRAVIEKKVMIKKD
ncbi:MAG: hypothetical protein PHY14_04090 [Candidatus Gracilibacteria bacterium]|nr:hypothetical protein [Candidatus Gracilibacteria bacterium]